MAPTATEAPSLWSVRRLRQRMAAARRVAPTVNLGGRLPTHGRRWGRCGPRQRAPHVCDQGEEQKDQQGDRAAHATTDPAPGLEPARAEKEEVKESERNTPKRQSIFANPNILQQFSEEAPGAAIAQQASEDLGTHVTGGEDGHGWTFGSGQRAAGDVEPTGGLKSTPPPSAGGGTDPGPVAFKQPDNYQEQAARTDFAMQQEAPALHPAEFVPPSRREHPAQSSRIYHQPFPAPPPRQLFPGGHPPPTLPAAGRLEQAWEPPYCDGELPSVDTTILDDPLHGLRRGCWLMNPEEHDPLGLQRTQRGLFPPGSASDSGGSRRLRLKQKQPPGARCKPR